MYLAPCSLSAHYEAQPRTSCCLGKVLDPREKSDQTIVAFNTHVARDARVEQALLSVHDGVLLIRKRS